MSTNPASKILSYGTNFTTKLHNDTYPLISPLRANLTGKTVLITGASKGIGRATAISFAQAGCSRIALCARSSLTDIHQEVLLAAKQAGRNPDVDILCLEVDVTSLDSVTAAAERITEKWGKIDILINNAGYLEPWVPLVESDPEKWWRSWEVNIRGPYFVTKAFIPLLLARGETGKEEEGGIIINVSSIGAHFTSLGASGYQSAKLALLRFTEFLDAEFAERGIVALAIHPGGVVTELASGMPAHMVSTLEDTPELAGDSIVWLVREKRAWLRGRYISVNWDVGELEKKREEILKGDLLKVRMDVGFGGLD